MEVLELIAWTKEHRLEERTFESFWSCFWSYKEEDADEFLRFFGQDFDQEKLWIYIDNVYLKIGTWPPTNFNHVVSRLQIEYHGLHIGEYRLVFDLKGEIADDIFVLRRKPDKDWLLLREFALDLPYTADEEKRALLSQETRCITALFERHMGEFYTDFPYVRVECVEEAEFDPSIKYGKYDTVTITAQIPFQSERFFQATDEEKKRLTLELLKQGIDLLVQREGWDASLFEAAYEKVIALNYVNQWMWKKPKVSPTKKYVAEVFCEHGVHELAIWIIVKDRNGREMKRVKVRSVPSDRDYMYDLGTLRWLSRHEVALFSQSRREHWTVKVQD